MGWFFLYLITCSVNVVLIRLFTDLNIADAVFWLWMLIPGITYGCGGSIHRKE